MIFKVAWRNIWRNPLRSLVVMFTITLGLWAGIVASALVQGINHQRLDNIIRSQTSHIQIHHQNFNLETGNHTAISDQVDIKSFSEIESVQSAAGRVLAMGMVASANSSEGVVIKGIDPEKERSVSIIDDRITDGKFLETGKKNRILIGQALAQKLKTRVGKKLVLTFQHSSDEMISGAFRVQGIFRTSDAVSDGSTVFIDLKDLERLAGTDGFHQIALLLNDEEQLENTQRHVQKMLPGHKVESWKELMPGLATANDISDTMNMLLLVILMAAMSFGIVNNMLMSVLERTRELGVLMAIGMNRAKIFGMIVFETLLLMSTATPIGMLIAWLTISYFGTHGLDLSFAADGLNKFGVGAVLYPFLDGAYYLRVVVLVIFFALAAAIYPAWKATQLQPAEAIRKI